MTEQLSDRDEAVDVAKGICILLVICIHSEVFEFIPMPFEFIAVPMFFFMSGFFDRSSRPFRDIIGKGARTLLWPSMVWCVIAGAYLSLLTMLKGERPSVGFDAFNPCTWNGPCWFLVALFWVKIMTWGFQRMRLKPLIVILLTLLLGYGGMHVELPLCLDVALAALPLYFAGKLLYPYRQFLASKPAWGVILGCSLLCLLLFLTGVCGLLIVPTAHNEGAQVNGFYRPTYLAAILAIIMVFPIVLFLCSKLTRVSWLKAIGRQTLGILVVHSPMCHTVAVALNRLFVRGSAEWCLLFLAAYVAIVALSYWLTVIIRRRLPALLEISPANAHTRRESV